MEPIKVKFSQSVILLLTIYLFLVACNGAASEPAMVVSISSSGDYTLSSHKDGSIVLWDIKNKTSKKVAGNANIYSAYFVKDSPYYLWQGLDNNVHIANAMDGSEKILSLPFPVYGHLISSDLKHYFASDEGWGIYYKQENQPLRLVKSAWGRSFLGFGKLLNLSLSGNGKSLLQSGYTYEYSEKYSLEDYRKNELYSEMVGPAIWDISSTKPTAKLDGNAAKTYATFSPDGKYVVSGSENGIVNIWQVSPLKFLYELGDLVHGVIINPQDPWDKWIHDKNGLIERPKDFHGSAMLSAKFIDPDHFLRFTTYEPYAILYEINNPLPLKYLPLGTLPFPAVSDYSRNAAIDSAPEAGILVTGQRDGNGINVYKYDKDKQTLDRIWVTH